MCSLYVLRLEEKPADDQQEVYSNRSGQVRMGGQTIRRAGTKVKGTRFPQLVEALRKWV